MEQNTQSPQTQLQRDFDLSDLYSFFEDYDLKQFDHDNDILSIIQIYLDKWTNDNAFYIIDLGQIIAQYNKWIEHLPMVKPYYAVKCNPNLVIIKLLGILGCNFDCASKQEITQVLHSGVDPDRIIFANPCKASTQIKYARQEDIDILTFDSVSELYKIKLYHPKANLLVRIKVDDSKSICRFNCKFGVDSEELDTLFSIAKACDLSIIGVSFHVGSNCYDLDTYKSSIIDAKKAFIIAQKYGFNLKLLDIGGGFPANDDVVKFSDIAQIINDTITDQFINDPEYSNVQFIAEPGRYFVSTSHTLVVNIIGKKEYNLDGQKLFKYYLNDGIYGSFNCIHFDHAMPKILPYNEQNGVLYKSTIFGPTCDSMDVITTDCMLPDLAIGEWVFIDNFGAYTTAAASNFNGFERTGAYYIMRKPQSSEN